MEDKFIIDLESRIKSIDLFLIVKFFIKIL